jgi:hypothetical protein
MFNEAGGNEIPQNDSDSVAAHFGDRSVGVAVVHEIGRVGRHRPRFGLVLGPDDPQHAVGADARMPVTQGTDQRRTEVEGAVEVGHDDEVVPGAVPLQYPHA